MGDAGHQTAQRRHLFRLDQGRLGGAQRLVDPAQMTQHGVQQVDACGDPDIAPVPDQDEPGLQGAGLDRVEFAAHRLDGQVAFDHQRHRVHDQADRPVAVEIAAIERGKACEKPQAIDQPHRNRAVDHREGGRRRLLLKEPGDLGTGHGRRNEGGEAVQTPGSRRLPAFGHRGLQRLQGSIHATRSNRRCHSRRQDLGEP